MKDRAWIEAQIADLKGGVQELTKKLHVNQGAILALEQVLREDPPPAASDELSVADLETLIQKGQ